MARILIFNINGKIFPDCFSVHNYNWYGYNMGCEFILVENHISTRRQMIWFFFYWQFVTPGVILMYLLNITTGLFCVAILYY